MTGTVWKYELTTAVSRIEMPTGAVVLDVDEQYGAVAMWAWVNPAAELVTRVFHIVGTGTPIPDGATTFHGTALTAGGALVFHIFEEA
ncbi:DUF7352 domain-containing protein [Umezawaea tangerina]|uniref:DUF7352 domain-containing protein n=1 Tax=Umezawaea tangerina TaxID=84725 RepID=A0A2T0SPM6_9PSEU|nr:hypothetical protein [Umezawaea tangerina]PRY35364.1 hypothetical protein CLV43_114282 [Umezawaea tangerina]